MRPYHNTRVLLLSLSLGCLLMCVGGAALAAPNTTQKARAFHHRHIVIDLHADTLYQLRFRWYSLNKRQRRHDIDLPKLRQGGMTAQVFVLFIQPRWLKKKGDGWRALKKMHRSFLRILRESKGALVHARNAADVKRIKQQGKIAAFLAIEGLHPLEGDLGRAKELVSWGLTYAGLVWNNSNAFATSAKDAKRSKKMARRGLTPLGRKVVRLLEAKKVLVDLSHASKRTFWDVHKIAKRPYIASHSNAQAHCRHYRNLDDRQLRAIARAGGVVGINFYTLFLRNGRGHRRATLRDVIRHIDHIVGVAGIRHVALGSDFDGILSKPKGLYHVGHVPRLTRALYRHGYTQEALRLLLGGNVMRLLNPKSATQRRFQRAFAAATPSRGRRRKREAPKKPSTPLFQGPSQQMAVSAHPIATRAALEMLKAGGNAFDAAVAAAFAVAVVEPYASGLGGGGVAVVYDALRGRVSSLDFRERVPLKSSAWMFVRMGKKGRRRSRRGHLAVGTPGMVAGMDALWRRYGLLRWRTLLAPAKRAAQRGFRVHKVLARRLRRLKRKLMRFKESRKIFLKEGKTPYRRGERLKQLDLAKTLSRLQRRGARDFYRGRVARLIVKEMRRAKGLVGMRDLRSYRALWKPALRGHYRGHTIYTMPSPSAGGTHMLQILSMLGRFPRSQLKANDAGTMHLMAASMRMAFRDLARFQGDARFYPVPYKALLSPQRTQKMAAKIKPTRAAKAGAGAFAGDDPFARPYTSHISVVDKWGNAVSMTLTINTSFGSKVTVPGTGILLNNEMDDFTTFPNRGNAYGLRQGRGNLILPGKTPLSAMTPTLVFRKRQGGCQAPKRKPQSWRVLAPFQGRRLSSCLRLRGVLGSPGGPTILTTVAQLLRSLLDAGMPAKEAMALARVHHQWRPHKLFVERRMAKSIRKKLKEMGHRLRLRYKWGNATLIWVDQKGHLTGAADPRGVGRAAAQ